MSGPLAGIKIVEMAGLGPAPFCGMLLSDLGAQVIRVERPGAFDVMGRAGSKFDVLSRGRHSLSVDLRKPGAAAALLALIARADGLIEGFRPGVMERMGLGPEVCLGRNERLVYGRMTGWGQDGPLAHAAGHDINYIALSGVLNAIGEHDGPPAIPLNFVGDFGGGGMLLALGMVSALLEAARSGRGQVIDAAMTDGAALLSSPFWGLRAAGMWNNARGTNLLDGGAHFYNVYACADGEYISIGSIEPQFYALLREKLDLRDPEFDAQMTAGQWPELKERLAGIFRQRTREQWCALLEGTDVCFAPVLNWDEAPQHPHNRARGTFIDVEGVTQPAPAPRFSRTPASAPRVAAADTGSELLREWGLDDAAMGELTRLSGAE